MEVDWKKRLTQFEKNCDHILQQGFRVVGYLSDEGNDVYVNCLFGNETIFQKASQGLQQFFLMSEGKIIKDSDFGFKSTTCVFGEAL